MSPTKLKERSQPTVAKTLRKSSVPPPPRAGTEAGGFCAPVRRWIARLARLKLGETQSIEIEPNRVVPCHTVPRYESGVGVWLSLNWIDLVGVVGKLPLNPVAGCA